MTYRSPRNHDAKELPTNMPKSLVVQLVTDLEGAIRIDIKTIHKKYNVKGNVECDMRSQKSSGTNKLFNISRPVFDVINDGGVLVVDELDASLHPLLTLVVTTLFNSKDFNRNNTQLVFATHDMNFYYGNYRGNQIYFVERRINMGCLICTRWRYGAIPFWKPVKC